MCILARGSIMHMSLPDLVVTAVELCHPVSFVNALAVPPSAMVFTLANLGGQRLLHFLWERGCMGMIGVEGDRAQELEIPWRRRLHLIEGYFRPDHTSEGVDDGRISDSRRRIAAIIDLRACAFEIKRCWTFLAIHSHWQGYRGAVVHVVDCCHSASLW